MTPDPAYIRYAFQKQTDKPVYIYFAGATGEAVSLATSRNPPISWTQHLADDPSYDGFSASLAGFESIVTTAPVKRNGKPMLDRVPCFAGGTVSAFGAGRRAVKRTVAVAWGGDVDRADGRMVEPAAAGDG